jgi:hypothetical protein
MTNDKAQMKFKFQSSSNEKNSELELWQIPPSPFTKGGLAPWSGESYSTGRGGILLNFIIRSDVAIVTNAINNRLFSAEIQLTADRCDFAAAC